MAGTSAPCTHSEIQVSLEFFTAALCRVTANKQEKDVREGCVRYLIDWSRNQKAHFALFHWVQPVTVHHSLRGLLSSKVNRPALKAFSAQCRTVPCGEPTLFTCKGNKKTLMCIWQLSVTMGETKENVTNPLWIEQRC